MYLIEMIDTYIYTTCVCNFVIVYFKQIKHVYLMGNCRKKEIREFSLHLICTYIQAV